MRVLLSKHKNKLWIPAYILVGALAIYLYFPAKEHMIVQDAWIWIIKSNVTFNFILFFFIYGVILDKITKKMSRKKAWAILIAGAVLIVVAFQFAGGYETIWSR